MVVVSHLFFFIKSRGAGDSFESPAPLFRAIYFPTAPVVFIYYVLAEEAEEYGNIPPLHLPDHPGFFCGHYRPMT